MTLMSHHNISYHNRLQLCADYQGLPRYGDIAPLEHLLLSAETQSVFQCFISKLSKYIFIVLLHCLYLYPTDSAKIDMITVKCLIFRSGPMIFVI